MTTAPGITHWLPIPFEVLRDPLSFFVQARERFGDVFRYRFGPVVVHFLFHPDHVRRVLQDQQKNYLRAGWQYQLARRLLGNGLVLSEGDFWLRQRRLAQPAFQRQRLAGYVRVMADATSQMLARWDQIASAGQTIDIVAEMARLALAIAGRTLFSRDVSEDSDAVGQAFAVLQRYIKHRLNRPLTSFPIWVPTPRNRRFKEAVRTLHRIVLAVIDERRRDGRDHGDLLSMLMQARDEETGEGMTDRQLSDESLTFLIAGHETTAVALTWTWYLLATHPAVAQRVRADVTTVLGYREPALEDILQLNYLRMVAEESMRLYPPLYSVIRTVINDDEIGGFSIPARSTVVLSPFVTHRHPGFWERPDVFDPDQFAPERVAQRPKYAYFPFLGGPHQCIGNEFAMLEIRLIVAMVLRRFHLELLPGQTVKPVAVVTLRPSGPVRMAVRNVHDLTKPLQATTAGS